MGLLSFSYFSVQQNLLCWFENWMHTCRNYFPSPVWMAIDFGAILICFVLAPICFGFSLDLELRFRLLATSLLEMGVYQEACLSSQFPYSATCIDVEMGEFLFRLLLLYEGGSSQKFMSERECTLAAFNFLSKSSSSSSPDPFLSYNFSMTCCCFWSCSDMSLNLRSTQARYFSSAFRSEVDNANFEEVNY